MAKQYGLIVPNKAKKATLGSIIRPSIFDDDSDSDTPRVTKPTGFSKVRKQDTINQNRALEEDPTVYQYDEIYDDMTAKKTESKLARKDIEKKPKYITKLLAAADRRKRENERRIERLVQKEREAEGEEFKDKESFVTSAYKQKLEEMKALEEQEKREEYLEAIGDVKRQGNLDGFYRHLYDQKVNYEDEIKKEPKDSPEIKQETMSNDEADLNNRNSGVSESENTEKRVKKNKDINKRKYRSRNLSEVQGGSESEEETVEIKKEHLPSNLDADSDFSIDSSSDSESETKKAEQSKENADEDEHEGEKLQLPEKGNVLSDNAALAKKNDGNTDSSNQPNEKEDSKENEEKEFKEPAPKIPKIDIWKKRTVGVVFDEALKRYFERKAAREALQQG